MISISSAQGSGDHRTASIRVTTCLPSRYSWPRARFLPRVPPLPNWPEFLRMFSVDVADKTLSTVTKSGCCWHQFNTYKVVGNRPVFDQIGGRRFARHDVPLSQVRTLGKRQDDHRFPVGEQCRGGAIPLRFPLKARWQVGGGFHGRCCDPRYADVTTALLEFGYVLDVLGHRQGKIARKPSPMFWNKGWPSLSQWPIPLHDLR